MQQDVNSPKRSPSTSNLQRDTNSPKRSTSVGNLQQEAKSPKQSTNAGNSQQKLNSPKPSTSPGNLQEKIYTQRSPNKATRTGISPLKSPSPHRGMLRKRDALISSDGVEPSAIASHTNNHSNDVETAKPSYASEQSDSGSSSSEKDKDESLKKKLFFSPKKSPNKNQSLQGSSKTQQVDSEEKRIDKSRIQGDVARQSNVKSLVARRSSRRKPDLTGSEDEQPNNDSKLNRRTAENSHNHEKRKQSTNPYTDSESEIAERLPAPKIPSPPKRILRSRNKICDVDSEDGTMNRVKQTQASSCEYGSHTTTYSRKGAKGRGKKKTLEKRVVHKRVKALVKETSTQSSEEESDETYRKPAVRQQARSRASKVTSANTVMQRTVAGSLKRKEKNEGASSGASVKKPSSKGLKQRGNKDSNGKQNEMSDETSWSDEEIQRLNEYVWCVGIEIRLTPCLPQTANSSSSSEALFSLDPDSVHHIVSYSNSSSVSFVLLFCLSNLAPSVALF